METFLTSAQPPFKSHADHTCIPKVAKCFTPAATPYTSVNVRIAICGLDYISIACMQPITDIISS